MLSAKVPAKGTLFLLDTSSLTDVTSAFTLTIPGQTGPVVVDFPADTNRTAADVREMIADFAPSWVSVGSAIAVVGTRINHVVSSGVRYVDYQQEITLKPEDNRPMLIASLGSAVLGRALAW